MRIKDIHVEGFGVWRDLKIADLSDNITVFFGPNEAGKTTLMQFIRAVLYGFSHSRVERYLPPVRGGKPGGALSINQAGRRYHVQRRGVLDEPNHEGRVTVTHSDGSASGRSLRDLLSGVDESIFNNVFALGLREIQELNTLDATEASQQLYNMTSGIDRVSLMEVMHELKESRDRILGDAEQSTEVTSLLAHRDRLRQRRDELLAQGRQWLESSIKRGGMIESPEVLEQNAQEAAEQVRILEAAMSLHPRWQERAAIDRTLEDDTQRAPVSPRVLEKVDRINQEITALRRKLGGIRKRRARLRKEARGLQMKSCILEHAERIDALVEEGQKLHALEQQIQNLQPEIDALQTELQQRIAQQVESSMPGAVTTLTTSTQSMPPVTAKTLAALRIPARAVKEASQAVKDAKDELERSQREAAKYGDRVERVLGPTEQGGLGETLEELGELIHRLKRRIELEDRLHAVLRRREEMEEDIVDLMEDDVMPFSRLMWTGVPFVIGFTMLLSGLFWPEITPLGGFISVLGMGGLLFGMMTKVMLERQAASELEDCNRQLSTLNRDVEELEQERDQLDRYLPKSGGPLDVRLHEAENRLDQLQQLAPADSERQLAMRRGEAAAERLEEAERQMKAAKHRWRSALRKQKLPESMSPAQIRELAEGSEETLAAQQQIEQRKADLEARQRELQGIGQRIEQAMYDVQLTPASRDPKSQFKQLSAALIEQRKLLDRRRQLKREYDNQKRGGLKELKQVRKLRAHLQQIFREHQVEDEEQLRHAAEQEDRLRLMREKRDKITKAMQDSLGDANLIEPVFKQLRDATMAQLEGRLERFMQREQEALAKLALLREQEGEVRDEIRNMADDHRLGEVQFELAMIDAKLMQAVRRWRVLTITERLLAKIRDEYESARQPQTLADASKYLDRLTGGRYVRVWTPFGEPTLRIDDAHGDSVNVDVLSCGTREAVFVSLRLALAEEYARRGAELPMILDDVLVNLDTHRVQLAVDVLRDFAEAGHQILLFTCHDHVREMFRAANVEVRALPTRDGQVPALPPAAPPTVQQAVVAETEQEVEEPIAEEATREAIVDQPLPQEPLPEPIAEPMLAEIEEEEVEDEEDDQPLDELESQEELDEEEEEALPQLARTPASHQPTVVRVVEHVVVHEAHDASDDEETTDSDWEPELAEQPVRYEYITEVVEHDSQPHRRTRKRRRRPAKSVDPYEFERTSMAREDDYLYDDRRIANALRETWFHDRTTKREETSLAPQLRRESPSQRGWDGELEFEHWWEEDAADVAAPYKD